MPNHIISKIEAMGKESKTFSFENYLIEEKEDGVMTKNLNFNLLIPMPKELEGTQSPSELNTEEQREKSEKLIDKYGFDNWYDWSIQNWGTKWNAYQTIFLKEYKNRIEFQTAWGHPVTVIEKLSLQNPTITFKVKYADEDIGQNCDEYKIKNGEILTQKFSDGTGTEKSKRFAKRLWN